MKGATDELGATNGAPPDIVCLNAAAASSVNANAWPQGIELFELARRRSDAHPRNSTILRARDERKS